MSFCFLIAFFYLLFTLNSNLYYLLEVDKLAYLKIEDNLLMKATNTNFQDIPSLRTLILGKNSFKNSNSLSVPSNSIQFISLGGNNINEMEQLSFSKYPNFQSFEIGENCFQKLESFNLSGKREMDNLWK